MTKLLIELQYLGSISYYRKLLQHAQHIVMEAHENFEKSTYRNRCYIASPNGKLRLTIPVEGGKGQRALYADIKIDYEQNWQKIHWQSLTSCYRNSPYFEFYEHRFEPFFTERFEKLFDFNRRLMELLIELLELDVNITYTNSYQKRCDDGVDFRSRMLPAQIADSGITYRQVFQEKTGFLPDLSIVDLLFSEGPRAKEKLLP